MELFITIIASSDLCVRMLVLNSASASFWLAAVIIDVGIEVVVTWSKLSPMNFAIESSVLLDLLK